MTKIYTHPDQPQMQVEVILASQGTNGAPPIYTLRLRYPRIIHGEIMTHRVFSRNARSSRAVPVKTMLNEVLTVPFVPWHWGKNQSGMQAAEECNELVNPMPMMRAAVYDAYELPYNLTRKQAWLHARNHAVATAEALMEAGYHKQIPNRLLEPFSWIDTLITSTNWANFLHLRDHKDAEPHLQDLARLVKQALKEAVIQNLDEDQWHWPYITAADVYHGKDICLTKDEFDLLMCQLSAARCARISYKPFDGDASYERELERYNQLVTSERVHASPLEHQAQVDTSWDDEVRNEGGWEHPHLSGNFAPGWIQFRKLIPGEAV
jgi:thymidylate synthase ThyX